MDLQFIFGLVPGWWLSEEPERTSSPSLSPSMWQRVLKGASFSGIDVELRDYESREDLYSISNMLSSVPTQSSKLAGDNIVVVISNKAPPPTVWLDFLRESIADAVGGPLPNVQTLEFETRPYSNQLCIFRRIRPTLTPRPRIHGSQGYQSHGDQLSRTAVGHTWRRRRMHKSRNGSSFRIFACPSERVRGPRLSHAGS